MSERSVAFYVPVLKKKKKKGAIDLRSYVEYAAWKKTTVSDKKQGNTTSDQPLPCFARKMPCCKASRYIDMRQRRTCSNRKKQSPCESHSCEFLVVLLFPSPVCAVSGLSCRRLGFEQAGTIDVMLVLTRRSTRIKTLISREVLVQPHTRASEPTALLIGAKSNKHSRLKHDQPDCSRRSNIPKRRQDRRFAWFNVSSCLCTVL